MLRAQDACTMILWQRDHGPRKRVASIAQSILSLGWQARKALIRNPDQSTVPPLTHDALTFVIDESLIGQGLPAADPAELQTALNLLMAKGLVTHARQNPAAYIIIEAPTVP